MGDAAFIFEIVSTCFTALCVNNCHIMLSGKGFGKEEKEHFQNGAWHSIKCSIVQIVKISIKLSQYQMSVLSECGLGY